MSVTIVNIGDYVPAMPPCEVREQLCGVVRSSFHGNKGHVVEYRPGASIFTHRVISLTPGPHLRDEDCVPGRMYKIVTSQACDINFLSWDPYQNPQEKV